MPFDIIAVSKEATIVALWLTLPALLISMVIGLIISIFQAVTQIQDQSLQFVPKLIFVFLLLFFMFQFNYTKLETLALDNFSKISTINKNNVIKPEYDNTTDFNPTIKD